MKREELREFLGQLLTTEGRCTFAEQVAKGELTMDDLESRVPLRIRPLLMRQLEAVKAISKNPCAFCGTFQLEEDCIGSGCCSRACYALNTALREPGVQALRATVSVTLSNLREEVFVVRQDDLLLVKGDQMSLDGEHWVDAPVGLKGAVTTGWFIREDEPVEEDWDGIMDRMFEGEG